MDNFDLDQFLNVALFWGLQVLYALVIFIIGRWVASLLTRILKKTLESRDTDASLVGFLTGLCHMGLMVLVVVTALGTVGIQTTTFAAILASAGLAIGLALQGSLSNFAAGVLILLFKPFKIGDYIETGGTAGLVADIGILVTTLNSLDNKRIIIPNSVAMGGIITNYTANSTRRVDMAFGVSYSDDLDKVQGVIKQVFETDQRVLKDPAPDIFISGHGDSSINLAVRPWVQTADYWDVYFATHKALKQAFDREGISIPFPQRDLHIVEDKTRVASS